MAPVVPSSISNVTIIPVTKFVLETNNRLTRCCCRRDSMYRALSFQKFILPQSASVRLFSTYRRWSAVQPLPRVHILEANGTEGAFEEPVFGVTREDAGVPADVVINETPSLTSDTRVKPSVISKRGRTLRKSEMPPVKNEDLLPGATFTGKVRSIQPFGAFVDIGAFTEGLIHISNLSDSFVTDVNSIVSIGQEIKVRVMEANFETGRISLTMRESNNTDNLQQQKDSSSGNNGKPTPARKKTTKSNKKSSKLVKGQELQGTVKNMIRAGSFISLPEGEEGFLPTSEESVEGPGNSMGSSSLQVGQEVRVSALHVTKGRVTLTMKKEDDVEYLNPEVINVGVVHEGTKPFVFAFRKNKDIAKFLDERENMQRLTVFITSKKVEG